MDTAFHGESYFCLSNPSSLNRPDSIS